ncbi:rho GTPase-activating protein 27 isoform X2 [Eublepharis macularius]|uniref:Rho GTPase-activating protein 27 isoform X2 n=1 Tax=Eublepharis macularius TaxID=481883 RepID=A0AA97K2A1_EUBMA|nr:rho GTPase-activating protein 27 isoform X2 [Eublepharis macularius]
MQAKRVPGQECKLRRCELIATELFSHRKPFHDLKMEAQGKEEETYILVEYAFEYTAKDGRLVSIKPNERYVLLKRTNDHWWHVRKSKETRPFYIPAKYVRELPPMAQTEPPSENLPPTTLLENADLRASIGVAQEQPPEYEYRFVSAAQACEVQKTDMNEPRDSSQAHCVSSQAGLEVPLDVGKKVLPPVYGTVRATPGSLRTSHGCLKPHCPTGPNCSRVGYNHSAEYIRPTVSLDDLARFTSHSQAGMEDLGLYKAASWGHPRTLLKSNSENFCKPAVEEVKQAVKEWVTDLCARQHTEADPVYVNLQELQKELSTAAAASTDCIHQPHVDSLPSNWETHKDTESGQLFYYNPVTGQTTWDYPVDGSVEGVSPTHSRSSSLTLSPAAPPEWDQYVDQVTGQVFFYNTATGETSWDAPVAGDTLSYPEMQPALAPYSPADRRPPTPETDYPDLSPDELDRYPEEDYSPVGSFSCVPSPNHSWGSCSNQDGLVVDSDMVPMPCHHHSTSSGSSLDSSTFGIWPTNQSAFSPPKEEQFETLEKAGMLHRTKTAEKGKRLRKNWSSSWTVLQGGVLTFFKDSKHSASGSVKHPSVLSSPEHTVELRGAMLSWAPKDKSSKKHVLELKTREGSEYLIQHDSETIISMWQKAIADSISRLPMDFPLEDNGESATDLGSKEQVGSNREKEGEKKSPASWHSSSSLNTESESSKVRNKLRKFLLRRPTLQSLRERGYIKDQVFGCPLQTLCDREKSTVPQFVRMCIRTVENRGLDIDGLYRVSGNLATIQKLRYKVDRDERLDLCESRWDDVHVITGALKLFFRELPEPLFPFSHFNKFIAAIKIPEPAKRILHLRELVHSLPAANRDTMKALFQHLCRVIEFQKENRMSAQSIAIVFGPTLLKPEAEEGNMTVHMVFQNQIVEQILSQFSYIFPES